MKEAENKAIIEGIQNNSAEQADLVIKKVCNTLIALQKLQGCFKQTTVEPGW